jgi:enamine deaminase RidA (YjgF/YER057c/UK114 family)
MFGLAEDLLRQAGMEFSDVVRTWIYMRDIDRDYLDLNRARRVFFGTRGIDPAPASTGIGGGPVAEGHHLCLSVYAVKSGRPAARTVMTSPTLNEAAQYGADFVRGMKVVETNKVALHVSGTASIDEHGTTAHVGDFDAQADRMLVNIAALLAGQGARFGDVVSAITYLKHPADAGRVREKLHAAGFEGFPHALVAAPICRPDLLCETEALAVLRND